MVAHPLVSMGSEVLYIDGAMEAKYHIVESSWGRSLRLAHHYIRRSSLSVDASSILYYTSSITHIAINEQVEVRWADRLTHVLKIQNVVFSTTCVFAYKIYLWNQEKARTSATTWLLFLSKIGGVVSVLRTSRCRLARCRQTWHSYPWRESEGTDATSGLQLTTRTRTPPQVHNTILQWYKVQVLFSEASARLCPLYRRLLSRQTSKN